MARRHAPFAVKRPEAPPAATRASAIALLRHRNFRLLWAGQSTSRLGDQFYLIALPWLVLQITGSAVQMGSVLALEAIPRALFMLVGGAVTDRFAPRTIMVASYVSRFLVVGVLAVLVVFSTVGLWMIYVAALLFGLADAFHFPAQASILPHDVSKDHLDVANMFNQGATQLSMFIGPLMAGVIIALVKGRGTGLAISLDAVSFAIAAWLLALMTVNPPMEAPSQETSQGFVTSMREGISYVWRDAPLRGVILLFAGVNLLVDGPFDVGVPVLAHSRFALGAAAFGIIASTFGGGMLLGTLAGGLLRKPSPRFLGTHLLLAVGTLGVCMALLGMAPLTAVAAVIAAVMGLTNGYVVIVLVTWVQRRTPDAMMGRAMSVLMMASVGLNPLSTAVAGAVAGINVSALLVGSGLALAGLALLSSLSPATRRLESRHAEVQQKLSA